MQYSDSRYSGYMQTFCVFLHGLFIEDFNFRISESLNVDLKGFTASWNSEASHRCSMHSRSKSSACKASSKTPELSRGVFERRRLRAFDFSRIFEDVKGVLKNVTKNAKNDLK